MVPNCGRRKEGRRKWKLPTGIYWNEEVVTLFVRHEKIMALVKLLVDRMYLPVREYMYTYMD
jgi:hypothetical protein